MKSGLGFTFAVSPNLRGQHSARESSADICIPSELSIAAAITHEISASPLSDPAKVRFNGGLRRRGNKIFEVYNTNHDYHYGLHF